RLVSPRNVGDVDVSDKDAGAGKRLGGNFDNELRVVHVVEQLDRRMVDLADCLEAFQGRVEEVTRMIHPRIQRLEQQLYAALQCDGRGLSERASDGLSLPLSLDTWQGVAREHYQAPRMKSSR